MRVNKLTSLIAVALLPLCSVAQPKEKPVPNWQNLDLQSDGVFGISTEKAYSLLKGKKSQPVTVAVIDGGVQTDHPDLKAVIWTNPKEIPGNGKDDDKNGYADDVHGWNFIGSAKGNVQWDNLEIARQVRIYKPKFESVLPTTPLSAEERKQFLRYRIFMTEYMNKLQNAQYGQEYYHTLKRYTDSITRKIARPVLTMEDLDKYKPANDMESKTIKVIKAALKKDPDYKAFDEDMNEGLKYYDTQISYHLNLDFDPRSIVGDNYENNKEKYYGNGDVAGPDADHGSHVAGIIGAVRDNNVGVKGVADNVRIMSVRTVPDGDERDKDVANAIRYAADNGAKVINMSFGKSFSPFKGLVDSAIRYAAAKDVLLIHAAGNDGENTDKIPNFPNRNYGDSVGVTMGSVAPWIEVGASGWKNDEDLVADFSNYGKKSVDVFAPGVKINSTIPNSLYKEHDGTSMASPVVAGLAALIRSYYPALSAIQVKDIIMRSVTKVDHKVKVKNAGKLDFSEVCLSGGVVNAYNALQLAASTKADASSAAVIE
ncbi:S8 family peptidase [Hufsiella ginkgonis]|uniref:S8 family serine peptidase n=1 Tax=Hufsiella ginkgonis TaxID=2695274 RepID=A0A7K1Y393_9SPHI|nr:S8 family peptidase [Hufsiella ginkgonis]MXV17711.1 S8 family serine peptidase [Hufsiella ginkgonis]